MQPMLWVALIGVAAAATGVGFLNTNIMLNVQNFGVGEATLETPVSDANIDLSVSRIDGVDLSGNPIFKNIVSACSFHYPEGDSGPGLTNPNSKVICKLTDENGNVIAEGEQMQAFFPSQTASIRITDLAYEGSNFIQNVEDITIVALRGVTFGNG
ncbi:MAG: hypothetical protein O6761_08160 [Thaumarchaeota archaeon]|nr:hypothetical protein [Nitrososphaerota archaeon]